MTLIGLSSVEKFYGGRAVLRGLGMKVNAGRGSGSSAVTALASPRCFASSQVRRMSMRER